MGWGGGGVCLLSGRATNICENAMIYQFLFLVESQDMQSCSFFLLLLFLSENVHVLVYYRCCIQIIVILDLKKITCIFVWLMHIFIGIW